MGNMLSPMERRMRQLRALLSLTREPTPFECEMYTLRGIGAVKVSWLIADGIDSWDKVTYQSLRDAGFSDGAARFVVSYKDDKYGQGRTDGE